MSDRRIENLIDYGIRKNLLEEADRIWAYNQILMILQADSDEVLTAAEEDVCGNCQPEDLAGILDRLCALARKTGALADDGVVSHDLFDTKLMGVLTPRPSQIRSEFSIRYDSSPETATNWFYEFSGNTNYIL